METRQTCFSSGTYSGLRGLIESAPVLAWRVNDRGRVDILNRRATNLTGLREGCSVGELEQFVHAEDLPSASHALSDIQGSAASNSFVRMRGTHDPYRWFELHSERVLLKDEEGPLL